MPMPRPACTGTWGPVIVAQRGTPVRLTLTNRPLDSAPLYHLVSRPFRLVFG